MNPGHLFAASWFTGLLVIASCVIGFVVLANLVDRAYRYQDLRKRVSDGHCIEWDEAMKRCKESSGFLVIECRRWPRKIWFVAGEEAEMKYATESLVSERGLIVRNAPAIDEDLIKTAGLHGRIVEFRAVLYRTWRPKRTD